MSRLGLFVCLLMLVSVAVCLDLPQNMKPPEMPKDGQNHPTPGHFPHPDTSRLDSQHPDLPRPDGGQMPKGEKPESKPPQEAKS